MNTIGKSNAVILGLIADRRITRSELNKRVKEGSYPDIHRELIAWAIKTAGL
jgi:hypothetical protein